jgi:biopolymer transport protein ExbD
MSASKRTGRMQRRRIHRDTEVELNLIPLIDIMSVMVAFLLVYSADVEVVQNAQDVRIPQSVAQEKPKQSVVVMITPDHLFVQGELVTSVAEIRGANSARIDALSAVLSRPMVGSDAAAPELAEKEITVLADKTLPYEVVKRVMATCTGEGYGHISLAVLEKETTQI